MNKVIMIGRFTKDAEIRHTSGDKSTTVARFTLAVDRDYKKDGEPTADFPSCVAFGKIAEFVEKYTHKGIKMAVEGRLQTGSYDDKDGKKVYTTTVVVEHMEFVEPKSSGGQQSHPAENNSGAGDFIPLPPSKDEELPFSF